jgi:hypothetical protein
MFLDISGSKDFERLLTSLPIAPDGGRLNAEKYDVVNVSDLAAALHDWWQHPSPRWTPDPGPLSVSKRAIRNNHSIEFRVCLTQGSHGFRVSRDSTEETVTVRRVGKNEFQASLIGSSSHTDGETTYGDEWQRGFGLGGVQEQQRKEREKDPEEQQRLKMQQLSSELEKRFIERCEARGVRPKGSEKKCPHCGQSLTIYAVTCRQCRKPV